MRSDQQGKSREYNVTEYRGSFEEGSVGSMKDCKEVNKIWTSVCETGKHGHFPWNDGESS